ncbi:hypothetical protein BX286_0627 [Streptomyces sp. 3211.6]|uniref:hypothetical protein n=1 Tax=Streptomyces TaxID=1883 RepID=UPI0009A532E5|nr:MULTISPECIES: hypothetical protein [Streptomyces]RKT02718.1 hypothetical protein BX286_0627 [Streptomyces sp. 3211.6]RPF44042.1 hypothetical protein EDD96_0559 [Streptomyces sp. Ag109_G2-6]
MRHGSHTGHRRPAHAARAARLLMAPLLAALLLGAGPDGSGETVSLDGDSPGERLDVTLTRFVDPAGPAPAGGADRLVAVGLRLENTGTVPYEDSPAPAAHLLDTTGGRFTGLSVPTDAGPSLPGTVTLEPGRSAEGFVTFRLPEGSAPAAVQFALESGAGDDVAQWSLS